MLLSWCDATFVSVTCISPESERLSVSCLNGSEDNSRVSQRSCMTSAKSGPFSDFASSRRRAVSDSGGSNLERRCTRPSSLCSGRLQNSPELDLRFSMGGALSFVTHIRSPHSGVRTSKSLTDSHSVSYMYMTIVFMYRDAYIVEVPDQCNVCIWPTV